MRSDELDFVLPPELIAQTPTADRGASRLLYYARGERSISHRAFADLPGILRPGDVLVFNDARVLPARLALRKPTGGRIEGLFVSESGPGIWVCLLRNLSNASPGLRLEFETPSERSPLFPSPGTPGEGQGGGLLADARKGDPPPQPSPGVPGEGENLSAVVLESRGQGEYHLEISSEEPAAVILERIGRMPLPPYIRREKESDEHDAMDRRRYQTVYAKSPGAVAAPTAGLHFTDELLAQLDGAGIERVSITLHVGLGTFKPITSETLEAHAMHHESYNIPATTADALNRAKRERRRIVAVGTTSARVLESQPADEPFAETAADTSIFIYPPYRWKHVDALITNFHLPRSTLIALVAAFVGLDEQRRIYQTAIELGYRFFSYGDAMLLE
jgi:S-adenosylmethionine:tRNA ribosyltransferase-isomerase